MCRLLGVVVSELADFRFSLREAPRSLAALSPEHPHGWGLAVHQEGRGWEVHKHAACALNDDRFCDAAAAARGDVLVAHVRKATVGATSLANTHPFRRGRWIFAHNGTIDDRDFLRRAASKRRLDEIEGETDSELFFAMLLTAIDAAGATEGVALADAALDRALGELTAACRARATFGAANFLLSDGESMYAHRWGRSLYVLERGEADRVRESRRSSETNAEIEARWSQRREAILVASEELSDEPWVQIAEGSLLRLDVRPRPSWRVLVDAHHVAACYGGTRNRRRSNS